MLKHTQKICLLKSKYKLFQKKCTETEYIKFIDLFAGTGGFSLAIEKYDRFQCVFANDMIKSSQDIYQLNNPNIKYILQDLNTIQLETIPNHDILCGGFPCQPFSIAGQRKGFDDNRSNVFWKILDIIKYRKPNIVILENVKNLKSHDKGNTFKVIETKLSELGYYIKHAILDTCKITNIPQHRERIYIVCFKDKDKYEKFTFDFIQIKNKQIKQFLEEKIPDKYYYSDKFKVFPEVQKNVTKHINENILYQYRRYYVRENKSNCCPTLTANMGGGGHNVPLLKDDKGIRKLTPRECFNLQGFPSSYKLPSLCDSSLYKLAGNAISVPVVQLIAKRINSLY
jgi:DNA (cytosine-5)-methyltransferase 1